MFKTMETQHEKPLMMQLAMYAQYMSFFIVKNFKCVLKLVKFSGSASQDLLSLTEQMSKDHDAPQTSFKYSQDHLQN